MVTHACDPSTWELEAEESEFMVSFHYVKPYSKEKPGGRTRVWLIERLFTWNKKYPVNGVKSYDTDKHIQSHAVPDNDMGTP